MPLGLDSRINPQEIPACPWLKVACPTHPRDLPKLNTLLEQVIDKDNTDKPVVLMGRSMGCLDSLHRISALPKYTRMCVVLVAPAVGLNPMGTSKAGYYLHQKSWTNVKAMVELIGVVGRYALRRVIRRVLGVLACLAWSLVRVLISSSPLYT